MDLRFEWDSRKAARNLRRHGVSFAEAVQIFADPNHILVENDFDGDEQRYTAIGLTFNRERLVIVVFVERDAIRIISARKAGAYETVLYNAQG